jgi:7,8-dihydropterin-6-yl-methyl-4-(beta-D-ribofuranosyl)aminobenzene 5'-phosphate synthase
MEKIGLKEISDVEILTLQDNYIDITASDNSEIITRAGAVRDGTIIRSISAEHGFSVLFSTGKGNERKGLIFDFGFSGDGAGRNALAMDLDLGHVKTLVLSHGHSDHTGGLKLLATLSGDEGRDLLLHPAAFRESRYIKVPAGNRIYFPDFTPEMVKDAGLNPVESIGPKLIQDDTVLFLGEIPRETEYELGMPSAHYEENDLEKPDPLEDDTAIVALLKDKGLVILSGCAHAGIINTVRYAQKITGEDKVFLVMGGFHLNGPAFEHALNPTIEALKKIDPAYIVPTHCTGRNSIARIEEEFPDKFLLNMSGTT